MAQSKKQKEWKRKHYIENKDIYISKQAERRAFVKKYLDDIKLESGCVLCGYNKYAEILDFHHKNAEEKEDSLFMAVRNKWGQKRIDEEIAKCDVLCSNCHKEVHIIIRGKVSDLEI